MAMFRLNLNVAILIKDLYFFFKCEQADFLYFRFPLQSLNSKCTVIACISHP